jgi:hypothetical protein
MHLLLFILYIPFLTSFSHATSLASQLKGPLIIDAPIFPWKYTVIVSAGIFGLYVFWRRYIQEKKVLEKHSVVEDIHARPSVELGALDWQSKIPWDDDPLFAENSEHLLRNFLQHIWKTNVYHLTYQELLQLNNHQSGALRVDMEWLRRVLMLLQRARYAKLELDREGMRKEMEKILG